MSDQMFNLTKAEMEQLKEICPVDPATIPRSVQIRLLELDARIKVAKLQGHIDCEDTIRKIHKKTGH